MGKFKLIWNFYSVFKAMRQDALRYRHIRSTKRKPEQFDASIDADIARSKLL